MKTLKATHVITFREVGSGREWSASASGQTHAQATRAAAAKLFGRRVEFREQRFIPRDFTVVANTQVSFGQVLKKTGVARMPLTQQVRAVSALL